MNTKETLTKLSVWWEILTESKTDKGLILKPHKELMQINKIDYDTVEK